jgi:hypothetical protein
VGTYVGFGLAAVGVGLVAGGAISLARSPTARSEGAVVQLSFAPNGAMLEARW